MITSKIEIDKPQGKINFILNVDDYSIFNDDKVKSLFFKMQNPELSMSMKLAIMAEMFMLIESTTNGRSFDGTTG